MVNRTLVIDVPPEEVSFDAVNPVEGTTVYRQTAPTLAEQLVKRFGTLEERGRRHWDEFHRRVWTLVDLASWEARIPNFDCKCRDGYKALKEARPVVLDRDGRIAYEWKFGMHTDVSMKLNRERNAGKELLSLDDARACWFNEAPCRSDRLVITVATGQNAKSILKHTAPLMDAYATKCKADFVQLTNVTSEMWQDEKFRVEAFAKHYDQTLFLDCDCVVLDGCPDLFGTPGLRMHNDLPYLQRRSSGIAWAQPEYDAVMDSQGLGPQPIGRIWNSGVVQCTRATAGVWHAPARPLPATHCSEQFWVQFQAEQFGCAPLDSRLNWQWWFEDFEAGLADAWLVHFANHPDKAAAIADFKSRRLGR